MGAVPTGTCGCVGFAARYCACWGRTGESVPGCDPSKDPPVRNHSPGYKAWSLHEHTTSLTMCSDGRMQLLSKHSSQLGYLIRIHMRI